MKVELFSDPNCPFCYATEERLHELGVADRVEWCGVEHAPELPVPTGPSPHAGLALRAEVESIRKLAPEIPIEVPSVKPNTGRAILLAAAALRLDPVAGRGFIRSLYSSFWQEDLDLADEQELAGLADVAGLSRVDPGEEDQATVLRWRQAWLEQGSFGVPLLRREDGETLYGLTDTGQLAFFFSS